MTATLWSKFFWNDWQADPCLRMCSLAARGLWIDLLCIAAKSSPTGFVAIAGRPCTSTDIARLTGVSEQEVESLLGELSRNGVFSRDAQGRIYSRRMVRDNRKRQKLRQNGQKGGVSSCLKNKGIFARREQMSEQAPEQAPEPQKPEARYQKENIPPPPPDPRPSDQSAPPAAAAAPDFVKIIQAFDAARTEIWGDAQSRLAPAPADRLTANDWIKSGIDLQFCADHFRYEMAKMKEKNNDPPRTLRFFSDSLIRQFSSGKRPEIPPARREKNIWELRMSGWNSEGFWMKEWGPPPSSPDCLCPSSQREAA